MISQTKRERVLRRYEVGCCQAYKRVKEAGPAAIREDYLEEAVTKDGQDFSKMASGKA